MSIDNPLDTVDYDPVRHLNQIFADSSALSSLGPLKQHVELYKAHLDYEISLPNDGLPEDDEHIKLASNAPEELGLLEQDMESLREKGRNTEEKIRGLTSGIKRLDQTKSNLIQSITVLKRLQMLTTAFSQLSAQVRDRQYHEMVQTLPAVLELMGHFKPYRSINQVAQLSRQIGELQTQLSDQIMDDFSHIVNRQTGVASPNLGARSRAVAPSNLSDACLVLEKIPGNFKEQLISWYCSVQLKEYRTIFKATDEAGSLENTSRRYAYLKRLLKRHQDEMSRYFAPSWKMEEHLCKAFCETTKEDIQTLLSQKNIDVELLLGALQDTMEFEQYLLKRFGKDSETSVFIHAISSVFHRHLNIWIEHQDRLLHSKIQQYKTASPLAVQGSDESAPPPVLTSSADLFVVYRQMLAETAKLSTGRPLLDLHELFKKYLAIYSYQVLRFFLPSTLSTSDQAKSACIILNTADYCSNTIGQLETRMVQTIDENFKNKINFEDSKEKFLEIVNLTIGMLASKVDQACAHAWRGMVNTNWSKLQAVADQSSYVADIKFGVEKEVGNILSNVTKDLHKRMICDRIVDMITSSFFASAAKCRPISEVSAEQMLLDLYVLKGIFLEMPEMSDEPDAAKSKASAAYTRHVTSSVGRVETVLKVILTQSEPPEGLVQNYFYLIKDKNPDNFVKVLELKGITSKSGQNRFLELFNTHMRAHDNLQESSAFLSEVKLVSETNTPDLNGSATFRNSSDNILGSPAFRTASNSGVVFKEGIEKGFGKLTQDASNIKLNERFGRLFRRDGRGSPGR